MAQIDDDDITIVSHTSQPKLTERSARQCPKCGLAVADSTSVCPQDGTQIFEAQEDLLADKYEFIKVTGSGGMSVVYKARRHDNGEIVAIKMMHSLLMNEQALKRFQQEAKAITSLRHPNIINVQDFGVSEHGQPYMVMDFIDGNTLADVIKEKGGLTVDESLHRFIQLCDALEHAHEVGVLHRDLKPSNIMISNRDGNFADARIVDFGIAKLLDAEDQNNDSSHLTRTGELFGSPLYMSPEQCRGSQVDARTDIYSMGCVMYETLTGRPPLKGGSMVETFVLQMTEVPVSMSEACPEKSFPDELESVIAKALEKDPDDRFQTMTELEYALMQIQPNQLGKDQSRTKRIRQSRGAPKTVPTSVRFAVPAAVVATALITAAVMMLVPKLLTESEISRSADLATGDQTATTGADGKASPGDPPAHKGKEITGGDAALIEALTHGDLTITKLDLSESDPPIHDESGKLLGKLKNLRELNLDESKIGNATLFAIETLPISELELRRTNINDVGVKVHICNHMDKTLKELALSGCEFVGNESIRAIGDHLNGLQELSITSLKFDNDSFASLGKLSLHHIYAELTDINDDGLHALSDMTSLTRLKLNSTQITDRGISYLSKLKKLHELGVADTKISDKGITEIANFKDLKTLNVGFTGISAQGLASLAPLKNLQKLYLYNTKLDDQALKSLENFQSLTYLNLANIGTVTDGALDTICKLPKLQSLDLGGNQITDNGLKKIDALHHLKTLVLYDCPVSLDGVRKLEKSNPELRILLLYPHKDEDLYWKDPRKFKEYPDS
ncbi:MAG: protein kinase [Cyanobacteria bacterium SZAS-4]|nr:protein kinase [Cyanobacteria bacterium SZAS-4]